MTRLLFVLFLFVTLSTSVTGIRLIRHEMQKSVRQQQQQRGEHVEVLRISVQARARPRAKDTPHSPPFSILCGTATLGVHCSAPNPLIVRSAGELRRIVTKVGGGHPAAKQAGPLRGYQYAVNAAPGGGLFHPAAGTISRAWGFVPMAKQATTPSSAANAYCDVAWYFSGIGNARLRSIASLGANDNYETGHIVGAQLDGDNDEPLNFFPHHRVSNGQGVWHRFEMIARGARNILAMVAATVGTVAAVAGAANCNAGNNPVGIDVAFTYDATYNLVPNGGTYAIEINRDCALAWALVPDVVYTGWITAAGGGASTENWSRAARRWLTGGVGAPVASPIVVRAGVEEIAATAAGGRVTTGQTRARIRVQYAWRNTVAPNDAFITGTHDLIEW